MSKRERTRAQLVDAAVRLYGQSGTVSSLTDVAQEAEMASGTIYNYYDSKDKLLAAIRERLSDDIAARIVARAEGVTDGALRVTIGCLSFLGEARRDGAWARACLRLLADQTRPVLRFERDVIEDLNLGFRDGRFTVPDVNVALIVVSGTIIAAMGAIVRGEGAFDDAAVVESILRGLGLGTREAKRLVTSARARA